MEELNKMSIEEKCRVVKHCRTHKTFQPMQCRVTLAMETVHLRFAQGKALETLQGGTGTRSRNHSVNFLKKI